MSAQHNQTNADSGHRHHMAPVTVASMSVARPDGSAQRSPEAMVITLDVDAVPGLREVFEHQRAGGDFDVVSRWGAAIAKEGDEAPLALVDLYLPEVDLGVEIAVDVDKYSDSLLAGIRSGKVILIDLELALAMQKEDIWSVLERYRPLVVQPPDAKPVIGVLQQRHDFPREVYEPERRDVTPETSKAELYSFIEDATIISGLAVQYYQDGTPTIVLVDPAVAEIREKLPEDAQPEGRWGLLAGGEHNVMRFDAFAGGVPLGRWLLFNPSESVVRAGASGAHTVMLLSERPNEDQQEAERQWRDGVPVWVPHVEVFRALQSNF